MHDVNFSFCGGLATLALHWSFIFLAIVRNLLALLFMSSSSAFIWGWFSRCGQFTHELATFRGGGGHFCGRVARLATRQRLLHFPCPVALLFMSSSSAFIWASGFGVKGFGFRALHFGFGIWDFGFGFGVWGVGFGVWGLGFGVWGLGFRVPGQSRP